MTPPQRGRTIFAGDAHHGDGKRFIVRADEKLTAFVNLESAIRSDPCGRIRGHLLFRGFSSCSAD